MGKAKPAKHTAAELAAKAKVMSAYLVLMTRWQCHAASTLHGKTLHVLHAPT
jgi:hypothetical protein